METYQALLRDVIQNGVREPSRAILKSTGEPDETLRVFGRQIRFDLTKGFPAVTCKRLFFRGVIEELLWFLRGETNNKILKERGVHIWDEWEAEDGELGPIYGHQWRRWGEQRAQGSSGQWHVIRPGVDQIRQIIQGLKKDPTGRRHIVSAWNVQDLSHMALPPCHCLFQFVIINGRLSCQLYQRSADIFLGVPFNIASYAALTHLIAHAVGAQVGEFIHTFGDLHLYVSHLKAAELYLSRTPYPLPRLRIDPFLSDITSATIDQITLVDYRSHPPIAAEVAV